MMLYCMYQRAVMHNGKLVQVFVQATCAIQEFFFRTVRKGLNVVLNSLAVGLIVGQTSTLVI